MSLSSGDVLTTNRLEEWKAARSLLKDFDDRVGDLRKYGFTVVTALLAINSFLLPSSVGGKDSLTDQVKLAAIGSMMLLIVALRYVERSYRLFQDAASTRARIIERILNFELTGKISDRFQKGYEMSHVDLVYFFFLFAVFGLGLAVVSQTLALSLQGHVYLGVLVGIAAIPISASVLRARPASPLRRIRGNGIAIFLFLCGLAILAVNLVTLYEAFHLSSSEAIILGTLMLFFVLASSAFILMAMRLSPQYGKVDWTIDRIECEVGDPIRITLTNLGEERRFLPNSEMFQVQSVDGTLIGHEFSLPADEERRMSEWIYDETHDMDYIWLREWDSFTWTWDETSIPGAYRIVPYEEKDGERLLGAPLRQRVLVKSAKQKFLVVTTDNAIHDCAVANWAEISFQGNRFDLISCSTHGRSLAECLRVNGTTVRDARRMGS